MFALHQSVKVFSQVFFKKLAGLGSAHKTALSFCQAFSLRLLCQRKSGIMVFYVFSWGKETSWKKLSFPHTPILQELWNWGLFFCRNACARRSNNQCSHCTQAWKFLVKFFSKNLRVWAAPIKNGAFFLPSFFFAPLVPKKKRNCGVRLCLMRGRKLFKKSFSSPYPIFQKLWNLGAIFLP